MYAPEEHLFTISHLCRMPRDLVWRAWTGEEHLQNWFRPNGMHLTPTLMEPWPEGEFRYHLTGDDGREMWGKWIYVEIMPPEKLVMIIAFTDKDENIVHYPEFSTCPLETFVVVEFREQAQMTLITVEASPYLAKQNEIAAFDASHIDMTQHWRGCFDRLDTYLKQIQ